MRGTLMIVLMAVLAADAGAEKIRIGVSVSLTGEGAAYGSDIMNAIVFANQELAGGAYELIVEDDKCNGKDATIAAKKLVEVDKVHYALGYGCSGALLAAAPIYEKAKVVVISAAATASAISSSGDYVFRTCPHNTAFASMLYDYISKKHKSIGLLSEETDYPQGLAKDFSAKSAGSIQVAAENFLPGTADFRAQLLKLRGAGIEALFVNPQAEPGFVRIVNQTRELGWDAPIYGNLYPASPTFLKAAGPRAEGIVFSDLPFLDSAVSPRGKELFARYVKKFGEPQSSDFYFVTSTSAFQALHEAIGSGTDVKDYLYTHRFHGVVPDFGFDRNGDVIGIRPQMKRISGGEPVAITADEIDAAAASK